MDLSRIMHTTLLENSYEYWLTGQALLFFLNIVYVRFFKFCAMMTAVEQTS